MGALRHTLLHIDSLLHLSGVRVGAVRHAPHRPEEQCVKANPRRSVNMKCWQLHPQHAESSKDCGSREHFWEEWPHIHLLDRKARAALCRTGHGVLVVCAAIVLLHLALRDRGALGGQEGRGGKRHQQVAAFILLFNERLRDLDVSAHRVSFEGCLHRTAELGDGIRCCAASLSLFSEPKWLRSWGLGFGV